MSPPRRPFRFGVTSGGSAELIAPSAWRALGRRLESLGYSTLVVPDHLGMLSAFAPLLVVAEHTDTLRIGTLVANSDFYAPLRLAQEAATVDLLTEGRLELGLGGGWSRPEYDAMELTYDSGAVRAKRLGLAIGTMKGAWRGDISIAPAGVQPDRGLERRAVPCPVQRPHPPLLIGGHGNTILAIAAREADIVGITGLTWHGVGLKPTGIARDTVAERVRYVEEIAGEGARDIEFNVLVLRTSIGTTGGAQAQAYASEFGLMQADVDGSPMILCGDVAATVEKLQGIREQVGISYFVVFESAAEEFAPVVAALADT